MPLRVFCCCTYRTSGRDWTKRDWAACWFIKALKDKPIRGYAHVPLPDGRFAFLDGSTSFQAPIWFADIAAARIHWTGMGSVAFIPLPDSGCGVGETVAPRTLRMARALTSRLGTPSITVDVLRWKTPMPSAHRTGGTRDPVALYERLTLVSDVPTGTRLILIDDVLASGAHLRAAAAFLADQGCAIAGAICAGRADNEVIEEDAFAFRVELLPDLYERGASHGV
jgi:hypothetical protein